MCKEKDYAMTKVDRLIEAIDTLSEQLSATIYLIRNPRQGSVHGNARSLRARSRDARAIIGISTLGVDGDTILAEDRRHGLLIS